LAGIWVKGSRNGAGARAGAQTLVLLAAPLNSSILRALGGGSKPQAELQRITGAPAQTTLRAQLKKLAEIGTIEKQPRNRFPGVLEYELTQAGRDLLPVITILEGWLARAPDGPLPLGGNAAKAAIKSLAEAWSATILRALAAGPRSLTELDGVIVSLSYPSLERRLAAMRLTGQIEARAGGGRSTPYAVTGWLRRGVAALTAAARWERRHRPRDTAPLGRLDAETIFLLTVPLLELPAELSGTCRMAIEISGGEGRRLAGVTVGVRNGRVVSCATRLQAEAGAWALGSAGAWLDAAIDGDRDRLEIGGDCRLALGAALGINRALFGESAPAATAT
jgi:DNA-binding HxlR family transcriptional regulator